MASIEIVNAGEYNDYCDGSEHWDSEDRTQLYSVIDEYGEEEQRCRVCVMVAVTEVLGTQ